MGGGIRQSGLGIEFRVSHDELSSVVRLRYVDEERSGGNLEKLYIASGRDGVEVERTVRATGGKHSFRARQLWGV